MRALNSGLPLLVAAMMLLGALFPSCSLAADFWVGPKGRDVKGSGGRTKPWATLQFAADQVNPGDTVHVLNGNYTGFYLSRGGTISAPIRFIADGQNARITQRNRGTPDGINVEGASHVVVDGFVINEMPRAGVRITHSVHSSIRHIRADHNRAWGIFTSFCDDISVEGNTASQTVTEHGIYISNTCVGPVVRGNIAWGNRMCGIHMNGDLSAGGAGIISGALIENNVVFDNGQGGGSGINCDGVQNSRIQNNVLYNNHSSGVSLYKIDAAAGSIGNFVINNTIVQAPNSRWAINIKNNSTNNVVVNNVLINKGSRGSINIAADSLSGFLSDYNIVADRFSRDDGDRFIGLREWQSTTGMDRHSRVAKPNDVFVNPESDDYHPRDHGPAVDAGNSTMFPKFDHDGKSRPSGPRPDIGAYEAKDAHIQSQTTGPR
jgi:parallel beta-helix repeat protein